jgi:hypothetical protein
MKRTADSAWSMPRVEEFLRSYRAPLRIAANATTGYPTLCSLWFRYDAGRLACATHRSARIARLLAADPRCAFELAPNDPPYFGVRGRGRATVSSEGAAELLGDLIDRYLGSRDGELARWLLGRAQSEVAISIEIDQLSAWDYTPRMQDLPPSAPGR